MSNFEQNPNINIVRPVSIYEFNARLYGNVVSRNKIKGKLDLKAFKKALKIISNRHIFLQCTFFEKGDKIYFKKQDISLIPLSIKYKTTTEKEKDNLYRQELNDVINPYKKLWRILLIFECKDEKELKIPQNFEMIVTISHSIGDGISLLNLVKEILEQTQAVQSQKILYENHILPIQPPADEILSNLLKDSINDEEKKQDIDTKDIFKMDINFEVDKNICKINFIKDSLSRTQTNLLIKKCKENNTTIHGILCAAMLKAIREKICSIPEKKINIQLSTAIDCRRRFPIFPGNEYLICAAFIDRIICSLNSYAPTIELSRNIITLLKTRIEHNIGFKDALNLYTKKVLHNFDYHINRTLIGVSNVGKINNPKDLTDFNLYYTDYTASALLPNMLLSVLTYEGSLIYTLLFTEPWWDIKFIKYIIKHFRKNLISFSSH